MNKHLNLFHFFNNNNLEHYEDNLSRAFALCLKHDTVFLDKILKVILPKEVYTNLFNTDYPDYHIEIDLQRRTEHLGTFSHIIAVGCSGLEIDVEQLVEKNARKTKSPITDLSIIINDTCLIFEFKRTFEDCSAQLKRQANVLAKANNEKPETTFVDLNWRKIVSTLLSALSLQRQINTENPFTSDFANFLERKHPKWFPSRFIKNISFPSTYEDPNAHYLRTRLDLIKAEASNLLENASVTYFEGKYNRSVISINWGWATEVQIDFEPGEKDQYIRLKVYPGDTKSQGWHLYKQNKEAIQWPTQIKGYTLINQPYLKFSHFNSGIFWYHPTPEQYKKTHTRKFMNVAGRKKKEDWPAFERLMEEIAPGWKKDGKYTNLITNSNRTYFDFSMGILLTVKIPYSIAQSLDQDESKSIMAEEFKKIILELKDLIDK